MKRSLACALVVWLSAACSEKAPDPAPAAAEPAAPTAATPPSDTPAASSAPAMLSQVGDVDLPKADAPASWKAGWQLKPSGKWEYAYTQQIEARMAGNTAPKLKQGMEVKGTLVVAAQNDSVADVELVNASSIVTSQPPGQTEQKREQALEPKKYGALLNTTADPPSSEDPLMYAILSVPQQPSAVGEPVTEALSMPVDAPEGTLTVEGTATWTLRGFVKCGEHTCAHYAHNVDISKLTVPEGVKGSYGAHAKAVGWTLFDVDDGALYQHKSATRLHLKAEVPALAGAPESSAHGAASQPAAAAEPAMMDMTQEHFHEVTRK